MNGRQRTSDVHQTESEIAEFSSLLLSEKVLKGLEKNGFVNPSPIQLNVIPLGKFGLDIIAQAKSGTGKTIVFAVIALELFALTSIQNAKKPNNNNTNNEAGYGGYAQVLILEPTRELAVQSKEVIQSVGMYFENLKVDAFIGGLSAAVDNNTPNRCHIIVGTPGRVKQLIDTKAFKVNNLKLFVLDEADKLTQPGFVEIITDIYDKLPEKKQVIAFSATYSDEVLEVISKSMKNPQKVLLCSDNPSLEGVHQYFRLVSSPNPQNNSMSTSPSISHQLFMEKVRELIELFKKVSFHQCIVFLNHKGRAEQLSQLLNAMGYPSRHISGSQQQSERLNSMSSLKNFNLRVLVSTDLTARGVDVSRVNLVVNLDLPYHVDTYMHRVGRTGRFGTMGVAVAFVSESEMEMLQKIKEHYKIDIQPLPETIPSEYYYYSLESEKEQEVLDKMLQIQQKALEKRVDERDFLVEHVRQKENETTESSEDLENKPSKKRKVAEFNESDHQKSEKANQTVATSSTWDYYSSNYNWPYYSDYNYSTDHPNPANYPYYSGLYSSTPFNSFRPVASSSSQMAFPFLFFNPFIFSNALKIPNDEKDRSRKDFFPPDLPF